MSWSHRFLKEPFDRGMAMEAIALIRGIVEPYSTQKGLAII